MSSSSIISHPFSEPTYHNGITRRTGVECRYPWSAYTGSGVPSESDIEFIHPQNPPVFEFPYPFNKPTNVPNGTPQDRVYEYDKIRFCVIVERLVGSSWQVFETIPTNSNVCFSETIYPPGIYRWHYVCQKRQNESNLSESSPYRYFRIDSSYSRVLPKRRWSTVYQLLIDNYKTQSHPVMLPDWGSKVSQAKAILASSDNDDPSTRYLLHHLFYARRPRPSSLPEWFHEDNTGVDIWTRFYRERFEGIVYSFDPDSQSNSNYSPTHRWSSSLFYDFPTRFPTWDDIVSYVNVSKQPGSNLTRLPRMLEVGSTLSSVQTRSMLPFISLCALVYVLDVTFSPSKRAQLLENIKHCVKIFFEKWFDFDSDGYIKNYIDEVSSTNDNQKMSEMASDDYNWRESFLSLALILDLLYDEFDEQFRDWFIGNLVRFWLGIARYYARSYRVRGWPPIFPVDPRIFSNKGYESHYNNYMMSVFVLGCVLAPHIKEYVRSVSELEFYHLVQESTLSYIWLNNPGFAGIEVIPSFGYRGGYHEGAPYHNWYLSTTLSFRAYMEQITLFPTLHPRVLDSLEDLHMTLWVENPRLGMGDYSHTLAIYDFNCMFAILRFTIPCFYSDGVVPDSVRKIMYNYARYFRLRTVRYTTHVDYHESVQTLITAIIRLLYTQPDFRLMDWAVHVLPPSSSDKFKVFPQTGRVYYRSSFSVNETTVSGGGVKIYSNGLDLKYKCSPYGSNSHSAEKNHHFLLSYKGYDIIGAPPRDSSIWLDARKNGFWMSMYIDAMNSNTIYAGRKIGNEVNWYRYTQQPFEMQLRAGLFPNYQERENFVSFGGYAHRHVLLVPELPPTHSSMPGRDNLSGFTEEHINDYYLCDEYSRRFVVVKTDPPIVVIYDRVKPRTEPLAFAWLYQALSVAGVLDPHFNGLSTDDFSLGAGNFEPLGSFRYEIRGARRARDLVRQVPLDTVEVSDNIYAVIQFLPPSGWGGPSVVSRRVWGTRPCWRRDSSGNPEERYGLSDLRRLCSFGFVDASAGRGENVTREQELSYIRRNIGSKSGEQFLHTTHLFFALSDVISVNTVFDPVTVIIPYDGQDGYKSENFVISRSDTPSGVEILIEDPNGTHQVNIDKVTGEANYWFFV